MGRFTRLLLGRRSYGLRSLGLMALIATFVFSGLAAFAATLSTPQPTSGLAAVGPVSEYGYPVWYKDKTSTRLELCLDILDPLCRFVAVAGEIPPDPPFPDQPLSVPDNFPEESFYWAADSTLTSSTGVNGLLVMALEAAWANGGPEVGTNIVFSRIRIRIDGLTAGQTYTITHPYGVDRFVADGAARNINVTEDCGIGPFNAPLGCRIGPFLKWDSGAPAGWVGDPTIAHAVTGSPYSTNYFRIEGPNVGGAANTTPCPDKPGPDCAQTTLFTVMGKLATNAGVAADQALYSRTSASGGVLNLHASSEAGQAIVASKVAGSFDATAFEGDGAGSYYARIAFNNSVPPSVTVVNTSDTPNPAKSKTIVPIDLVTITEAEYNADTDTLTVSAFSSDQAGAGPDLTVDGFGATLGGSASGKTATITTAFPPALITVRSVAGGYDTEQVRVIGGSFDPVELVALAPPSLTAIQGSTVLLDGTSSQGDPDTFSWTQVDGASVTLTGANTAAATFTAPAGPASLTFRLTVTRATGASDAVDVLVSVPAAAAPVAAAGPDQQVAQGAQVTLDGTQSTNAVSYSWTIVSGPASAAFPASGARVTFAYPSSATPMVVRLTVTGPGGSASDTVTLTPLSDTVGIVSAQYTRSKAEWRVRGTTTINAPNTVSVYYRPAGNTQTCTNRTGLVLLGSLPSDPVNGWDLRVANIIAAANNSSVLACSSAGGQASRAATIR